jgi:SAM-dependent methyltransferase
MRIPVPDQTSPASWLVSRRQIDELERFLPLVRGRLLDVGCGRVPHLEAFRPLVDDHCALDLLDGPHVSRGDRPPENVKFVWASAEQIPFKGGFDTVIALEVLEHLPHPWRLWQELARLVVPGGHVFVTCPFHYPVHEEPHDYFRFTAHGHRSLAHEAGFDVLWIRPKGGVLTLLVDIHSKLLLWVCRRLHLPTVWIRWLQRLLYLALRRETVAATRYSPGHCLAARRRG